MKYVVEECGAAPKSGTIPWLVAVVGGPLFCTLASLHPLVLLHRAVLFLFVRFAPSILYPIGGWNFRSVMRKRFNIAQKLWCNVRSSLWNEGGFFFLRFSHYCSSGNMIFEPALSIWNVYTWTNFSLGLRKNHVTDSQCNSNTLSESRQVWKWRTLCKWLQITTPQWGETFANNLRKVTKSFSSYCFPLLMLLIVLTCSACVNRWPCNLQKHAPRR